MKVYNKQDRHIPADAIYVGRPSKFGNPFKIGRDGNRTQVIEKYREWLLKNTELLLATDELKGRSLVCWCAPLACHADVLMEVANR